MTILKTDIKLMASEQLDDSDDGGGRMSGNEVVDGNVNNLFPDISRFDRVYGRVSLRKCFPAVMTANADTYYGAHVILTDPADDPLVHVCMFTTDSPSDRRPDAQDRIEAYVVQGARYQAYLWGLQVEGARAISVFQALGSEVPGVGDVLYIYDLANDVYQYVRITSVDQQETDFSTTNQGILNVVTFGLSDALRYDFQGYEPSDTSKNHATVLYNTLVADAAKYYGVMRPTTAIAKNDLVLNVDSIYSNLVPSAQSETPVADNEAGNVGVNFPGGDQTFSFPLTATIGGKNTITLPCPPQPGSLNLSYGAHVFTDLGGVIEYQNAGTDYGTIDYDTGVITWDPSTTVLISGGTCQVSMLPAIGGLRMGNSKVLPVLLSNRGYNYVTTVSPLPDPGSMRVDYMAQGKWYRLADDGNGVLRGVSGSGTINYTTGTVVITCGALPDADTCIMVYWGAPVEYRSRGGITVDTGVRIRHTVAGGSIDPGSLSITIYIQGEDRVITDDGLGDFTASAYVDAGQTNFINYTTGEFLLNLTYAPEAGASVTIDYETFAQVTETVNMAIASVVNITLGSTPIKPGSLGIQATLTAWTYQRAVRLVDDGAGVITIIPDDSQITINYPADQPTLEGATTINTMPVAGTIDYNTGVIALDTRSTGTLKKIIYTTTTETVEVT